MIERRLEYFEEPLCVFGHGQLLEYPKDGLSAFGPPHQKGQPRHIALGVIATPLGLSLAKDWLRSVQRPVFRKDPLDPNHSTYPGFEATFRCVLDHVPSVEISISPTDIASSIMKADRHQAIFDTVSLFEGRIRRHILEEDVKVDLWLVIVPDIIHQYGRPQSLPPSKLRTEPERYLKSSRARELFANPSLFPEDNVAANSHRYEKDFHDQLKGRLLDRGAVLQLVRESTFTIALEDQEGDEINQKPKHQKALEVAWHLSTAIYYKAGGQPWRLSGIRPGVCYIGLVYKQVDGGHAGNACCGAQMFLQEGDGLVFKGTVGHWWSENTKEFHLDQAGARIVMERALAGYTDKNGSLPTEVFIHGRHRFNDAEWAGFSEATAESTNLVGVRIKRGSGLKVFGPDRHPVVRGTAMLTTETVGYLWTAGFIPRLATYPGREVPNPLFIDVCRGKADLRTVMRDVLGLTKVNFNACIYGDGLPVTLRFADRVGNVLTAIPQTLPDAEIPPLPFRHYI